MKRQLKQLKDQVIVITGASSGIGLTTAEMAADRGAAVVLAARSESELTDAVARITKNGGRAAAVAADVADERQVAQIGMAAMREFGRIDTWVNNAGIGMYGRLLEQPIEEKRKLFDTNFWSVVYGCKVAVEHLRTHGGTIVNIGSEASDRAVPLLGIYSASKHAVRGYTDALRMEIEHDRLPIQVSLVKPGPIDTPFPQHAPNYMEKEPKHAPPVYPPEEVAYAILKCAEKPVREIVVGGVPRLQLAMGTIAPRLTDLLMERQMWRDTQRDEPGWSGDSLDRPSGEDYGVRRGRQPGHVMGSSAYTRAALSDVGRALPLLALGAVVAAGVAASRRNG
jgi:short-subunit dehydrogenase